MSEPLLNVEDLEVAYKVNGGEQDVLRDIQLSIEPGQTVGLVGESGSGKSTLALTVMRQLAANAQVRRGKIDFAGRDLLGLAGEELRAVWGRELSFVPQNPTTALNPAMRVGEQLAEALRLYGASAGESSAQATELLKQIRIAEPDRVAHSYPHQLSGGMQQRVMIALGLSG